MTEVFGVLRDSDGSVYTGALIKVNLNRQFLTGGDVYGNEVHSTHSDSYGRFYFALVPNIEGTYYEFTIVKDNVNVYNRVVPESEEPINFTDLVPFVPPVAQVPLLGCVSDGTYISGEVYEDVTDAKVVFSVPGRVEEVYVDNVLQFLGEDFFRKGVGTIQFYEPVENSSVLIRYS